MDFGFYEIVRLIGALGFFIFGMKVMSEGLQHAAGSKMRQILGFMTKNRYFGVFTGFLITCLVQSSSATTVMTVSFVNAGMLSLVESAGIMMGANIGTTLTGWIVAELGFKFKVVSIALPIIAVGLPLLFAKRGNLKYWGEFLIGFALLFMGLDELKNSVPDIQNNPQVLAFLAEYADMGIFSTLLFIGIGTLLTVIVQSSSAAMALTQTMCYQGWIPFYVAAPMILGENIGTTITAELASMVGNIHAKRSARINSLFNVIGVTWMVFLHGFYLDAIGEYMAGTSDGSPFVNKEAIPKGLAIFHTAFNISNVLIMIWFIPLLVKLVTRFMPSKSDMDEQYRLEYIETGLMTTPELSILEAKKETIKFGKLAHKMVMILPALVTEKNNKKFGDGLSRIKKYENITDRIEVEVADYLSAISQSELSKDSTLRIRGMLSIVNDLERIGDIAYQMSKTIERKNNDKIWFIQEQRDNLDAMFEKIENAFTVMLENMQLPSGQANISRAEEKEDHINVLRNNLKQQHLESLESKDYNYQSGMVYSDLFSSLEKLGDHIFNVNEAMAGIK